MEKLLRDLNIYAHSFINCNLTFTHDGNRIRVQGDEIGPYVAESIILNKKFGFIQWLVDNDKIDLYKIPEIKLANPDYIYGKTDIALMYLAISDEPIQFLCNILK